MLTSAFWAILVAVLGVAVWEVVVRKSVLIDNFSAEEEQVVIQHTTLPASAPRSKLASANHTSFPLRSDGVLFISHASSGPAREAALLLPRFGFHVLIGVKDKTERRSFLYSMRKGVELIDFDMADPSTYPNLIYRLRHIRRDLDRPVAGLVLNLADSVQVNAMRAKDVVDVAFLEERHKALVKSPFRIVQAFLELNMYQVFEDKKQQNAKLAQLTEFAANDTKPINPSGSQKSYPWNAQGLRLVTLTHEFDGGEASETIDCDADCLQQQLLVNYVRMLISEGSKVVTNVTFSDITSSTAFSIASVDNRIEEPTISYTQGIDWALDTNIESKSETQEAKVSFEKQVVRALVHSLVSRHPLKKYGTEELEKLQMPSIP